MRTGRSTAAHLPPRPGASAAAILRSLVFATAMFAVAALTGVLLSGAAPASLADPPQTAPGAAPEAPPDRAAGTRVGSDQVLADDTTTFARSMVVSGAAALAVSAIGLIIVGRRRRSW